jgi:hypothetical protein
MAFLGSTNFFATSTSARSGAATASARRGARRTASSSAARSVTRRGKGRTGPHKGPLCRCQPGRPSWGGVQRLRRPAARHRRTGKAGAKLPRSIVDGLRTRTWGRPPHPRARQRSLPRHAESRRPAGSKPRPWTRWGMPHTHLGAQDDTAARSVSPAGRKLPSPESRSWIKGRPQGKRELAAMIRRQPRDQLVSTRHRHPTPAARRRLSAVPPLRRPAALAPELSCISLRQG